MDELSGNLAQCRFAAAISNLQCNTAEARRKKGCRSSPFRCAVRLRTQAADGHDHMSMPPMPPIPPIPPGMPLPGVSSLGASQTMASVVSIRDATEAAF